MSQQASGTNQSFPFILGGSPKIREAEIIKQDAARTVILNQYTVMGLIQATQKWIPVTSATIANTDGSAWRLGILMADGGIAAASLAAADVTAPILVLDALVDASQLVWDLGSTGALSAQALTTALFAATVYASSIQTQLELFDIIPVASIGVDVYEN